MNIPMMAMQINEVTYPIAVACLPGGFAANYKESETYGCYLVINEMEAVSFQESGVRPILTIGNKWMDEMSFFKQYRFIEEKSVENQFAEIEKN